MNLRTRPIPLIILVICLLILSLSGFLGGIGILLDPSGAQMSLPPELLDPVPINTFLLPGLYLLLVYGVLSLVVAYGLWKRASWARLSSALLGIILIGWIVGQIFLWGTPMALQYFYLALGIVITIISLAAPCVKEDQAKPQSTAHA